MKKFIGTLIFGALFIGEIALLKTYDVAAIGPAGTEVGFSHLNQKVHDMTGVNMAWYDITDYIGYGAIAVCLVFAVIGLVQLIQRRSLMKVDREILALGGLFAVTIGFYVLFEKVVINCRPVLMEGETVPEPSFPSSHTVLVTVVMIALMMIIEDYSGDLFTGLIKALCVIITVVTVGGRLYCGVHWFTDIIGGLLLSTALLFAFAAIAFSGDDAKAPSDGAAEFSVYGAGRIGSSSGSAAGTKEDKKTGGKSTAGYTPKH